MVQDNELRFTLWKAQGAAAIIQPVLYACLLIIPTIFWSNIGDWWFENVCIIVIICLEVTFLCWCFRAVESLFKNPYYIKHILTASSPEEDYKAEVRTLNAGS